MAKKKYEDEYIRYGGLDIDVNRDYKKAENEYAEVGNFNKAGEMERYRNNKIKAGYGQGYEPTYSYNYKPKFVDKADNLRGQLENYDDFSWDINTDPSYRALSSVYGVNAKKASDNALASAAAANGGRLSSNAIKAASLAYQDKMSGLEAEIPQLREAAYAMYRDKKNDVRNLMYDYEAAEDVNYSRWSDDYNRRYENAWDLINNNMKEREFAETVASGQAQRNSLRFADALSASQAVGYVNEELSALTGIPPGTPTTELFGMIENMRYNLGNSLGKYPGWFLGSYGYGNEDSKTFEADSFDRSLALEEKIADQNYKVNMAKIAEDYANGTYTGAATYYGNDSVGDNSVGNDYDYESDTTSNYVSDFKNQISSGKKSYSEIYNEVDAMRKKGKITDAEAIQILKGLGLG